MDHAFRAAIAAARQQGGLYFAALLSEDRILQALGSARALWRGWVYTPAVTVWTFLSQCLSADHSCRDAVARVIAWRMAQGRKPCSAETGAYCAARGHLPEAACQRLVCQSGREVEDQAPETWRWQGRRVRVVDGSTVTMADTAANQKAYPQHKRQAPGCGFPIARVLVVFSLTVGTVLEAAIGRYKGKQTGENSLFRQLHAALAPGDVVLADRYFSGWFDIALLQQRRIDLVVRKNQRRPTDFRTGRTLGRTDHLVRWAKPARPAWMSRKQYAALPRMLELRELRVQVHCRGFRTQRLTVITTMTDAQRYARESVADLYRRRWHAELNLRSLKVVLQMDHLRCKTPDRVRNEFWMHLLGYNLIRRVMAVAAWSAGSVPWHISFKGTLQTLDRLLPLLFPSQVSTTQWCDALLIAVGTHVVGNRPDRVEPRRRKRRPKPYPLLSKPRREYKRHCER